MIPDIPTAMQRVVVTGSTGSGKSTLAAAMANVLGGTHIELDSLRFLPQWQTRTSEEFRALVDSATSHLCWVADGNYSVTRDIVWTRADTLIWLDYQLPLILWRLTRRTLGRTVYRTDLWNTGNRENILKHMRLNEESLYYWAFKTYWRRKQEIPALMKQPAFAHLRFVRFTSPRQTARWLDVMRAACRPA